VSATAQREPGRALVLEGARLSGRSRPTSLTIVDGEVAAIGEEATGRAGTAERVDLAGATALPGLWDAHVHIEQWAAVRRRLDLRQAGSPSEVAALVADVAAGRAPSEPIVGYGYRGALWSEEPHKDLLDAVAPGRVVLLTSNDLHSAWLSPAALARIDRGDHPTGVLVESECYRATGLLQEHATADVDGWVADALAEAASRGVTGIIDFEIGDSLVSWQRRLASGLPDVRVVCTVYRQHLEDAVERGWPSGTPVDGSDGLVEVGPLKLFVDGSLNTRTALCHDPYPGLVGSGAHGLLETPPHELVALLRQAADAGLGAAVHAIGDRANAIALDAFEEVGCRGRIEHGQLMSPEDVARAGRLGLTIGIQPAHLVDDRDVAEHHWAGRTDRAFPFRDLVDAGVPLELGSDAPVSPLDPWLAISAAVTRTDGDRDPWHPEQRIDVADALAASSRGRRCVAVGDVADLVLVEQDPLEVAHEELRTLNVLGTLVAGRWTHRAL
jgi:predicted amidohydrolase YtcJ